MPWNVARLDRCEPCTGPTTSLSGSGGHPPSTVMSLAQPDLLGRHIPKRLNPVGNEEVSLPALEVHVGNAQGGPDQSNDTNADHRDSGEHRPDELEHEQDLPGALDLVDLHVVVVGRFVMNRVVDGCQVEG